ncbi:MAG: FtsX-like permease family protein [Cyclobacteriaceae bacterium]
MKEAQPPKLAEKFLLLFLKNDLAEEVLGDLDEKFHSMLDKRSVRRARRNYWYQVLNYLRPFAFKFFKSNSIYTTMIGHNFKIGYRILLKNKVFSAINIGGLAMGMTVALLIGLWIHDELSFNKHHENFDRIVQVLRKDVEDGIVEVNSSLVGQVGVFMKETYPTVFDKVAMTFFRKSPQLLTVGKQSFDKDGYFFLSDAPEMLSLNMKAGSRDGLRNKEGILISETLAKTFFNDENPMGKLINLNTRANLQVTGVFEDLPTNSEFGDATFFASLELIYDEENPFVWNNYNMKVYAQLKEGVAIEDVSVIIKDIMKPHRDPEDGPMELLLLPMKDWHLNSTFEDGFQVTGKRMQYVKLYGLIGIFVLVLALINFMNLNTARYQNRGKEVGIRKAVGSLRLQLINQFFAESVLYATAAFILSILVVYLTLPWFNEISDKGISIPMDNLSFWGICLIFTLVTAILAGSYPAFFLSSFGPIKALSGTLKQGIASVRLRQGLVIFQFTISIILIIGTITVYNQIEYAKSRPVGYNQENLITVRGRSSEFYQKYDILRSELKRTGVVTEIAEANYPLMTTLGNNGGFRLMETDEPYGFSFNTIFVTHEYGKTTEWELISGRDFSRDLGGEETSIILSESAIEKMGLEDPVGKKLVSRWEFRGRSKVFTIIGVVKDMVKGSPFEPAMPLMVFASGGSESYLFIRIAEGANYIEALPKIQEAFERVLPSHPFNYEFVDDAYMTKFRSEERIGSLATFFSALAILISCLGLFGLSAFMVEQRTKEIGVRKVLGATTSNLWRLLSKDFSILVVLACLVAIPLASYFLGSWLEGYEYRIEIYWWIYAIAGISCLIITLLTVSFHSLKASLANPVESLRSE